MEDGGNVDLSGYVSTDDQIANEVNITDAGGNFTATEVEGALAELAAGSTDDQALSLAGNTLTLEDGGNVDLSAYLDDTDTDDQTLSLAGNTLSIADGNSVDLSGYVSTDDQIANEVNITDAGGNFTATEVEGALAELAAGSTDDQALSLAGNTLTLEDGGNVDLSAYLDDTDTDDQTLSLAGNTLSIADGNSVDLSAYVDTDTNTTNTSLTEDGTNLILTDSDTNTVTIALADIGTDDQFDDEVPLRTPIDVDEGGIGSPTLENNVQEVINAIAPITSKAARIFYPPSIAVDASTNGTFSIDLYQEYIDQYGSPTVGSTSAPAALPTYGRTELYYYVTYADTSVFGNGTTVLNMSIDDNGNLSYEVFNQPADYNSLINVVFVVK